MYNFYFLFCIMVKLQDLIKTKTVKFDSGLDIKVKSGMTVEEQMNIKTKYPSIGDPDNSDFGKDSTKMLFDFVVDWNVEGDSGKLEITIENFKKLPNYVTNEIMKELGLIDDEYEKKNNSSQ